MKIEQINENQIRCTLTSQDLADRHIRISELAYGSEKAKALFTDMIQEAKKRFGFEVEDVPFMVEAIPTRSESLVLLISKVENPDMVDSHFSQFTDAEEEEEETADFSLEDLLPKNGASDILDLFRKMAEEMSEEDDGDDEDPDGKSQDKADSGVVQIPDDISIDEESPFEDEAKNPGTKKKTARHVEPVRVLEFTSLDQIRRLARVLDGFYNGRNDLFQNVYSHKFYLFLHKGDHTPEIFNKVCNIAAEYADYSSTMESLQAFYEEHGRLIRRGDALQVISQLN